MCVSFSLMSRNRQEVEAIAELLLPSVRAALYAALEGEGGFNIVKILLSNQG